MPTRPSLFDRYRPGAGFWMLVVAALIFFVPAITSMSRKAATYDEPVYIVAGLSRLTLHDDTMKEDAPPIVPLLAGLSAWWHGLEIPGGRLPFTDPVGREYPFATNLLYRTGADAAGIVFWSRLSVLVPFGLMLLVTVSLWSRALFGTGAAAVALLLTALSPNLVAHGRLATADFPATATMLLAGYLLWRHLEGSKNPTSTPSRRATAGGICAGLALGLALVTKFTSLLLVPCDALIILVAGMRAARTAITRTRWIARELALLLVPALLVVLFAYGLPPRPDRYIHGLSTIYRNIHQGYPWYVLGRFHPGGIPFYYEVVLGVKCALPLLLLGLTSLLLLRRNHTGLVSELCLLLPPLALLAAATQDDISAGIRRVLPVLPVLALSASRLARPSDRAGPAGKQRRIPGRVLLGLLLAGQAVTSLITWPHYLSYFNEAAGGLSNGQNLLDDSNIDWGQDLSYLPDAIQEHGIDDLSLCYFGTADPRYYGLQLGDKHARIVPFEALLRPRPGVYAVSLHYLIRMRRWGRSWLDSRTPFARAGRTLLLYRIE